MELTENEILQKNGKLCKNCNRNTLLPYEYEFTCIGFGFNLIKRNMNLPKFNVKKFINRLKYAELKIFCICVDVYKIYEDNDYDRIYEVLSTIKK